jgi:hypothetical protein
MVDLRKLAAIDIAFLGYGLIVGEFAFGVVFSLALGAFVLVRGHTGWQVLLGSYLVCVGLNYVPMLWWAIRIGSRERARMEIAGELTDVQRAFAKFRRQSLVLLVPVLPLVLAVAGRNARPAPR